MTEFLTVDGISKAFGGFRALNDCTFTVTEAKITCLVGPNGAGKTTIFNAITGFLDPDEGTVRFKGQDITRHPPASIVSMGIARTFQNLRLFADMSVLDNVVVFQPASRVEGAAAAIFRPLFVEKELRRRREAAMAILREVGLADRARDVVKNLSYGEQKLLCVARVLATGADVILLDEPSSGLSHDALAGIVELILNLKRRGKTLLVVEHNTRVVQQLADEILFLHQGHLMAQGTPQQIINDPKLGEIYFGGAI